MPFFRLIFKLTVAKSAFIQHFFHFIKKRVKHALYVYFRKHQNSEVDKKMQFNFIVGKLRLNFFSDHKKCTLFHLSGLLTRQLLFFFFLVLMNPSNLNKLDSRERRKIDGFFAVKIFIKLSFSLIEFKLCISSWKAFLVCIFSLSSPSCSNKLQEFPRMITYTRIHSTDFI